MKDLLITTITAVLVVGCGESQQSAPPVEAEPLEPVAISQRQDQEGTGSRWQMKHDFAVLSGNIEAVKQHIADGADVNSKDTGATPLNLAAGGGHMEIVELLIAKGADVNMRDDSGQTPLLNATSGGHKEIIELFIAEGADVNAKGFDGMTPLHVAALYGRKEIAELFIAKGADVNAFSEPNPLLGSGTPLDMAVGPSFTGKSKTTETADLLRKHGGKTGEELKAEEK